MRIVAGIDPGLNGGVAVLNEFGLVESCLLPRMGSVLDSAILMGWLVERDVTEAIIEKAQSMPKQGVVAVFNYGVAYGQLLAVLQCLHIPYTIIKPQAWKRACGLIGCGKDQSRLAAIGLWPKHADQFARVMDTHRAEAALLARHQMRCSDGQA